ncbi:hypothetical protein [Oharaeibacter diazotrophicus]|uniref:PIN domain-containing protein n=1 Tax=Oharaeibacter diazotrophicus TaxID=1920512 RepID=A0A4V3CVY5_9HYPH|nr:hypothetical protein [Oharaeibacter diazotrophicus]TDP84248.1 hypothetical protein EDD54_2853 [Oharaeibacter diazotrophicus]BBE73285.1 hypothetical protein OHA_1_02894 [Pleomorphomonas sp. SM30]GLS75076.1 hypothetical protein GCM10007904_04110 [Oharaeibacter diazotrophicus]
MARLRETILVDTNVLIEAWRIDGWRALRGGYALETVGECVIETQTGFQQRKPEQRIDDAELRAGLKAIHVVSDVERASAHVRDPEIAFLDLGEKALWAHALARTDAWVLCGPDKASLRIGVRAGLSDRLVSLERLLNDAGHRPKTQLKTAYTKDWLSRTLAALALREGKFA